MTPAPASPRGASRYRYACRDGSAFLAGFCAGAGGTSHATANPYPPGAELYRAWDDGYVAGWSRRILSTVTRRATHRTPTATERVTP